LADLDSRHENEKTAAAPPATQPAAPNIETHRQELDQALDRLTSETKTAEEASPLDGTDATAYLEKTAAEIEAAEAHALVKEAELFAGAFFHSFLNHANQYAEAAGTKIASQQPAPAEAAPSIEEYVKVAAAQGAHDTVQLLQSFAQQQTAGEKVAQQPQQPEGTYADGVKDSLEKVAEFCHAAFNMGFADVDALVK
jgi:hypothetical protein